jgi:hypothetical protein
VVKKFLSATSKPVSIPVAAALSLYLTAFELDTDLYNDVTAILRNDAFATSAVRTSSTYSLSQMTGSLREVQFEDIDRTADRLASAIQLGTPFSLVRLGDGEGNFLAANVDDDNAFLQELCTQILVIWFGSNSVMSSAYHDLQRDLQKSIAEADFLGVPDCARLLYEQSNDARGYWGVYFATKYAIECTTIRHYVSPVIHLHMFKVPKVLKALSTCRHIHTVTCHPGFGSKIRALVGVSNGRDLIVPGEQGIQVLPAELKRGQHFPDVYVQTIKQIEQFAPGAVVLVAAGVCGKIYANKAKAVGCMGIDIGAIADFFMGIPSRAVFTKEHFAAGFMTTLQQSLRPSI